VKKQPTIVIKARKVVDFFMMSSLLFLYAFSSKECAGKKREGKPLEKSILSNSVLPPCPKRGTNALFSLQRWDTDPREVKLNLSGEGLGV